MDAKLFACLDIGRTHIHLMVGRLDAVTQEIEICKVGLLPSSGIKQGKVLDPRYLSEAIRHTVQLAEHDLGQTISEFYLGVDAMLTKLTKVEALTRFDRLDHLISKADIDKIMEILRYDEHESIDRDIDMFPVIYTLDKGRVTLNPLQMESSLLGVKGFLLQRRDDTMLHILRSLQYARVNISGLLHIGLAVGEVFLSREEKLRGAVILDLGSEGSKFYFFRSGFMQSDVFIPIGGRTFTRDIEIVLRCSFNEAEQLKFRYGFRHTTEAAEQQTANFSDLPQNYADYPHEILIPQILQARLEQLFSLARQELSQLDINWEDCSLKMLGGESMIIGLEESVQHIWSQKAEILKPSLSQVALPTFTSTFAMVHYVAKLYMPQTQTNDPLSWIDLNSEYMSLHPQNIASIPNSPPESQHNNEEQAEERLIGTDSVDIEQTTEKAEQIGTQKKPIVISNEETQRNQSLKQRIEGWRSRLGFKQ